MTIEEGKSFVHFLNLTEVTMGALAGIAGQLALGAGEDLLGGLGKDLLSQAGEGMANQLGGDVINSLLQGSGSNNANEAGGSQSGVENTDWGSDV